MLHCRFRWTALGNQLAHLLTSIRFRIAERRLSESASNKARRADDKCRAIKMYCNIIKQCSTRSEIKPLAQQCICIAPCILDHPLCLRALSIQGNGALRRSRIDVLRHHRMTRDNTIPLYALSCRQSYLTTGSSTLIQLDSVVLRPFLLRAGKFASSSAQERKEKETKIKASTELQKARHRCSSIVAEQVVP